MRIIYEQRQDMQTEAKLNENDFSHNYSAIVSTQPLLWSAILHLFGKICQWTANNSKEDQQNVCHFLYGILGNNRNKICGWTNDHFFFISMINVTTHTHKLTVKCTRNLTFSVCSNIYFCLGISVYLC